MASRKAANAAKTPNGVQPSKTKPQDYTSEGVKDNDIYNLPTTDWQLLGGLTILAGVVRLFKIYQPPSVVFDEVQYVELCQNRLVQTRLILKFAVSVDLLRSTSRAASSWTYTLLLPNS